MALLSGLQASSESASMDDLLCRLDGISGSGPISCLAGYSKLVARLATELLAKLEEIWGLRTPAPDWNITFDSKATIARVEMTSSQMVTILTVLVEHDYNPALSKLLASSDGHEILFKLNSSQFSTESVLKKQITSADEMLKTLKEGNTGSEEDNGTTAFEMQQAIRIFDAGMGNSITKLDSLQVEFDRLDESYLEEYFYICSILHQEPSDWDRRERVLQSAFNKHPFYLSLHNALGLDIISDPELLSQLPDSYLPITKTMGKGWVEKNLPKTPTIIDLVETRAHLLRDFLITISISITREGQDEPIVPSKQTIQPLQDEYGTNGKHHSRFARMKCAALKGMNIFKYRRFSIAIHHTAEAGTSLFLNALIGQDLFPSEDKPAIVWPCRLMHGKNWPWRRPLPFMTIDSKCFKDCVEALRGQDQASINIQERETNRKYIFLHERTKRNLLRVQEPNFTLPHWASGTEDVADLLALVNDIILLCECFGVKKPSNTPDAWPFLEVEFESLCQEMEMKDIILEIVALPESEELSGEDFFRSVAMGTSVWVPTASFVEANDRGARQISNTFKTPSLLRPDLVFHVHPPRGSDDTLMQIVAKPFWSDGDGKEFLSCSTRTGMIARSLFQSSEHGKPEFREIGNEGSAAYEFAKHVLGADQPAEVYNSLTNTEWKKLLEEQLKDSGLPSTIHCLVDHMVKSMRRTLLPEITTMLDQLHETIKIRCDFLPEIFRGRKERTKTYHELLAVGQKYKSLLEEWEANQGTKGRMQFEDVLRNGLEFVVAQRTIDVNKRIDAKIEELQGLGKLKAAPNENEGEGDHFTISCLTDAGLLLQEIRLSVARGIDDAKSDLTDVVRAFVHYEHFEQVHALESDRLYGAYQYRREWDVNVATNPRTTVLKRLRLKDTMTTRPERSNFKSVMAKLFLKQRLVYASLGARREGFKFLDSVSDRADVDPTMLECPAIEIWETASKFWFMKPFITQRKEVQFVLNSSKFTDQLRMQFTHELEGSSKQLDNEYENTKKALEGPHWLRSFYGEDTFAHFVASILNFQAAASAMSELHARLSVSSGSSGENETGA